MRPGISHTLRTRLESERKAPLHSLAYCLFGWDLNHRYVYNDHRFYECWGCDRHGLAVETRYNEIVWYNRDCMESYIRWIPHQSLLRVGEDYWAGSVLRYGSYTYTTESTDFEYIMDEIRLISEVHHAKRD